MPIRVKILIAGIRRRWREWLIGLLLVTATAAVYAPVRHHDFVNYDDASDVASNRMVQQGLTWEGVRWAFTTGEESNWFPLTRLSHLLDCQLFGMNAGAHLLVNVGFHLVNALLVFTVLQALTGAVWPSGFGAALFALHPLHVESVAWVAERKDVLSALFWLLAMGAYALYARRPSRWRYAAVVGCFALGLMAKPMVVTLPFVLLLLDVWPLRRLSLQPLSAPVLARLVAEKVPLLALAAASSVVTFLTQRSWGAMRPVEELPWSLRGANALVSYVRYLGMTAWPARLAVFYPHPGALPPLAVAGAGLLLAGVTAWVMLKARVRPAPAVGWLWYLGTLVPVIGLVQVGSQALADRYMYLPSIGLFIMAAWGLGDWLGRWRWGRVVMAGGAVAVIAACAGATVKQVAVWQNSVALFEHALAAGWESPLAHYNLAHALAKQGRTAEAIAQYRDAVRLKPDEAKARDNLGLLLADQGQTAEAIAEIREALRLTPDRPYTLNNLAWILAANPDAAPRDGAGAVRLAERACELTGFREADLLDTLSVAYAETGRFPEAQATAEKAVAIAASAGQKSLADEIRSRLPLYRAGQPYREPRRQSREP